MNKKIFYWRDILAERTINHVDFSHDKMSVNSVCSDHFVSPYQDINPTRIGKNRRVNSFPQDRQ